MLKNTLTIFLLLCFSSTFSQDLDTIAIEYPVWPICKLIPQNLQKSCFEESLREHIEKNIEYPDQAKNLELQSIVNVFFEIDESGLVKNIDLKSNLVAVKFTDQDALTSANNIFEEAALKIISKIPKMLPGKINNLVSSIPCKTSITYKLPSKNDLNQVFSLQDVEWPPLIVGCSDMDIENSKKCFKEKLNSFIKKNVKYPRKARDSGIDLGRAMGAQEGFGALSRIIGPILAAFIWAETVNGTGLWTYHTVFRVAGLIALMSVLIQFGIKKSSRDQEAMING